MTELGKRVVLLLIFEVLLMGSRAFASSETWYQTDQKFPSNFRVQLSAGGDVTATSNKTNLTAGALLTYGKGMLSVETGMVGISLTDLIPSDKTTSGSDQKLQLIYAAVPLVAKFNYIEKPMDTFSLKAGVVAAFLVNSSVSKDLTGTAKDGSQVSLGSAMTFAVVGFTGTTDLSEDKSVAFVVDGQILKGLTKADSVGGQFSAFTLSLGILFAL